MFFNVLSSVATFITGTLAGILIGKNGGGSDNSQPNQVSEPMTNNVVEDIDDIDDFIE
jgi:hypothetical protein